jgi:hypothetical protein
MVNCHTDGVVVMTVRFVCSCLYIQKILNLMTLSQRPAELIGPYCCLKGRTLIIAGYIEILPLQAVIEGVSVRRLAACGYENHVPSGLQNNCCTLFLVSPMRKSGLCRRRLCASIVGATMNARL